LSDVIVIVDDNGGVYAVEGGVEVEDFVSVPCADAAETGATSIAGAVAVTSMVRRRLDERDIGQPPGVREV
jgi:hypothetical protein